MAPRDTSEPRGLPEGRPSTRRWKAPRDAGAHRLEVPRRETVRRRSSGGRREPRLTGEPVGVGDSRPQERCGRTHGIRRDRASKAIGGRRRTTRRARRRCRSVALDRSVGRSPMTARGCSRSLPKKPDGRCDPDALCRTSHTGRSCTPHVRRANPSRCEGRACRSWPARGDEDPEGLRSRGRAAQGTRLALLTAEPSPKRRSDREPARSDTTAEAPLNAAWPKPRDRCSSAGVPSRCEHRDDEASGLRLPQPRVAVTSASGTLS